MTLISIGLLIAPIPTQSAVGLLTVGAFFTGLHSVINNARDAVNDSITHVDAVAGQNILLISKQLEYILGEAEAASKRIVNEYVTKIDTTVYDNLVRIETKLKSSINNASNATTGAVLETQAAANQVLNRLPFVNKAPHVIGAINIAIMPGQKDHDLEILGFNLIDARLNRKPTIVVEGLGQIPDKNIAKISDARLGISLGESNRNQLGFGPTGCIDEEFKIAVTAFQDGWIWTKPFQFDCLVMPCAKRTQVKGTVTYAGKPINSRVMRTNEISIATGYIDARDWNSGPENRTRTLKVEIPVQAKKVTAKAWWTTKGGRPKSKDAGSPVVGKGIVTAIGRITGDGTLYGKGIWATYHLRVVYELEKSGTPVPFVDNVDTVLAESASHHLLREDQGRIIAVSLEFVDENSQSKRDEIMFTSPPENQNYTSTTRRGLFEATINRSGMHIEKK